MTDQPRALDEALDDHDVTLALSAGQLVVVVIVIYLLLRIIRKLRA
jgi:hypothetical protein